MADARLISASIDTPPRNRFATRGVYTLADIERSVIKNGPYEGCALALHFGSYVPYGHLVSANEASAALGRRFAPPQGLGTIRFEEFETLRRSGGVEW